MRRLARFHERHVPRTYTMLRMGLIKPALSEECQGIHQNCAGSNDPLGSLLEAIKVLARDKSHEIYDLINDTRSGCYDS